jgi:phosphoribosylglycinamide formyltransferase-1
LFIIFLKKRLMAKKIALFTSGRGTNAEEVCSYFKQSPDIGVGAICSSNLSGRLLSLAEEHGIPSFFLENSSQKTFKSLAFFLKKKGVNYLVLAGFLLKVPDFIIANYQNKIINIHPSLLPKYGGKGMYGKNVHAAVINNVEVYSGITIHYVNAHYDDGAIIFQYPYKLSRGETADSLAKAIQKIEHRYFSLVLEKVIKSQL